MAKWSKNKVSPSSINNGQEYVKNDNVSLEELNAIVNNSLYAANIGDSVASQLASLDPDTKIEFKGSNPNLLINSDFRVNQRGQTRYTGTTYFYCVDRWMVSYGIAVVNNDGSISHTTTATWQGLCQEIEKPEELSNKTITFSANGKCENSQLNISIYKKETSSSAWKLVSSKTTPNNVPSATTISLTANLGNIESGDRLRFLLWEVEKNVTGTWYWAKLELGSVATAYSPRPYAEELALCQRYYQTLRVNDTQYCASTAVMYPNVELLAKMRATPTIDITTNISVRGNGSILGELSSFSQVSTVENMLVCTANTSALNVVVGNLYMFTNGKITADAEIY